MALIFSDSCCAICNQQLGSGSIFATWGVFLSEDDPLAPFCDAPIHWSCYANWPSRERFARAYFVFWVEWEQTNPYWAKLFADDDVLVTFGPAVSEVSVHLAATGSDIRVPDVDWEGWLEGRALSDVELHALEREAIRKVLPRLRAEIPSIGEAVQLVDWTAKELLIKSQAKEQQKPNYNEYNAECREIYRSMEQDGLACPHCAHFSRDFRFLDLEEERQSYFVCRSCARSFGLGDLN